LSLANRSVYLAGPIGNCTHEEAWEWRLDATAKLAPMKCFNPCKREFQDAGKLGYTGEALTQLKAYTAKEVVSIDKVEIGSSDCILAHFFVPKAGSLVTGTTMEIMHGFEHDKLVVVVTPLPVVHAWIQYHSHRVFDNFPEAYNFIRDFFN
jgi:hypothetical protein